MKNQFLFLKGQYLWILQLKRTFFCLSYIFGPRGPNFNFKIALETCLYKLSKPPFKLKSLHHNRSYGIKNVPPPGANQEEPGRSNSTRKSCNDLNCFVLVIICSPLILKNLFDKLFSVVGFWFKGLVDWKVSHCIK